MTGNIPRHIGLIMDGNGRWGKSHGRTRSEGHYAGVQAMEKAIDACITLGVEALTLYAFSSENWARARDEVRYLMNLPIRFFKQKLPEFMRRNIKIIISGDMAELPNSTRKVLEQAIAKTEHNTGLICNFAFNYGGRGEIVQATKRMLTDIQGTGIEPTEDLLRRYLYTCDLPELDLMIRTGGELRLSNFLLWQCAEAELYFTDIYFPDFAEKDMREAVCEYASRKAAYQFEHMLSKAK